METTHFLVYKQFTVLVHPYIRCILLHFILFCVSYLHLYLRGEKHVAENVKTWCAQGLAEVWAEDNEEETSILASWTLRLVFSFDKCGPGIIGITFTAAKLLLHLYLGNTQIEGNLSMQFHAMSWFKYWIRYWNRQRCDFHLDLEPMYD